VTLTMIWMKMTVNIPNNLKMNIQFNTDKIIKKKSWHNLTLLFLDAMRVLWKWSLLHLHSKWGSNKCIIPFWR
jgi:hypothetical protein